jgi:hypothetical protein
MNYLKINLELFGYEIGAILQGRKKLLEPMAGITNRTKDGFFVLFLDYDNVDYEWIKGEIEAIQKEFQLGDIYIFQSGENNYHVVGFDKLTREEFQEIQHRSSCDPYHKKIPWTFGKRVVTLRATPKKGKEIKLKEMIYGYDNGRQQSAAHANFFAQHYNIEIVDGNFDKCAEVIIAKYKI